eukprot:SAG31_NODE_30_length_32545_cov_9.378999_10_plen_46_part_00
MPHDVRMTLPIAVAMDVLELRLPVKLPAYQLVPTQKLDQLIYLAL